MHHLHAGQQHTALRSTTPALSSLPPPHLLHASALRQALPCRPQPTCSQHLQPPQVASGTPDAQRWFRSNLCCASASGSSGASPSPTSSSGSPLLQVMSNTRPIDRLRYQARFLFRALDKERKGKDTRACVQCK